MKIGFFGDSFCCEESNQHSFAKGYSTYIRKLKVHYNAEIVNLGMGGSSYWDCIIKQFPPFIDNLPDVCIFTWTDNSRLYHNKLRNITTSVLESRSWKDISMEVITHRSTLQAAREYFRHIHDGEKADLEQKSAYLHFDTQVLSKLKNTKIIHLWSFSKCYDWQNGIEIDEPLNNFVDHSTEGFGKWAANHIAGDEQNQKVFELIRSNLDSYAK